MVLQISKNRIVCNPNVILSASNIEKQRSQNTLDKKYSSVGASICSLKESPTALTEPPPSPPHHNLTYNLKHSIKRRFSTRDKKRERPDHGAAPVKVHPPKPPPQSCITACFGGQTGDVDNVKGWGVKAPVFFSAASSAFYPFQFHSCSSNVRPFHTDFANTQPLNYHD